ncbi:MAG: hypothetical protein JW395_1399 [Nitrospira sp.]|nr:hypothetical protein [Nitrospira sp.]
MAAIGNEIFEVHGQSGGIGEFGEKPSPIRPVRQKGFRPGGQDDIPPGTRNHPAVFHVGRQQIDAIV